MLNKRSRVRSALVTLSIMSMLAMNPASAVAREYFVSLAGDDANPGTVDAPFRHINHAARLAKPGDTVTVREGIYREWVRPQRGGTSEALRITYRAAAGEDVRIVGSEPATGWSRVDESMWQLVVDETRFGGFNPFATLSRHPQRIEQDEAGDGWGWLKYGRWTHLGDVYVNNNGLTEKQTIEEVTESPMSWYARTEGGKTTISANFGVLDPEKNAVEINHRPFAFFPEDSGLSYITVSGFTVLNVATHWAPPTAFQPGAIGSNGGHHWIIENNIVMYSKAVAISIGNPNGAADQSVSGHHIIRNNVILRCGQAGITGQAWIGDSIIRDNHIEEINYRKEFGGWETAAIKHHNGDGLVIEGNFIRGVHTVDPEIGAAHGIWNDYRNSNWRVDGNIVIGAEGNAILSEANWEGPNLYSNNILVDGHIGVYSSRGDAWVHNLFVRTSQRWENQPWGDRAQIGNARWLNNIFIGEGLAPEVEHTDSVFSRNVYLDGATPHPEEVDGVIRTVTPTHVKVYESRDRVTLLFNVDEVMRNAGYPIIRDEALDLGFGIDATVGADIFGKLRDKRANAAGPFARLNPGGNEFIVYEYPARYLEALQLLSE